ncbi:MAG TPA: fatty acid desaturase [Solirubrobacteraceae bacterium]|nr:fatty acid desaturase [Solirubrobacteraceae bacterium]
MSAASDSTTPPVSVTRIPDPREPVPRLSLPAFALFLAALCLWTGSSALALTNTWPLILSIPVNAVATYLFFTVLHDASHNSLSSIPAVNLWIGRVSAIFFSSLATFRTFRFIHMQHHRFTNDEAQDPDEYASRGPRWQKPLRWMTLDLNYMLYYIPKLPSRPRAERIELAVVWLLFAGLVVAVAFTGHFWDLILLLVVPARLATLWLGFAFDYLPHNGLNLTASQDRFKTTRNRIGLERLVSPLLLYQNYHLVHHLHPVVPFHRYIAVWLRNEDSYLSHDPALSTIRGRPITADEYRRMSEIAGHRH